MKLLKFALFSTMLLIGGLYLLAPVSWNEKETAWMLSRSKIINQSTCSIYDYLGKSAHAKEWSSFVKNIAVINQEVIADGQPGSRRLCLVQEDLPGDSWEEEILQVNSCRKRRLSIDKMKGFVTTANKLFTDQLYEAVGPNKTRLHLVLYLKADSIYDYLKFTFLSPYISGIFAKNLDNIKAILEAQSA